MPQIIQTKLTASQPSAEPWIAVAEDGATLELTVPPGRELVDAALTIQLPDDAQTQDLLAGAAVATSNGPGPWPAGPVTWVSVDWRARRGLVSLELTLKVPPKDPAPPPPPTHLRLRVSDGGPWVLATPVALIALPAPAANATTVTATLQLPGLAAARVLVELVRAGAAPPLGPEDYALQPAAIAALKLLGSRRPPTLTVSVAPATIVHHEAAPLPPSATLTVRGPLLAGLRAALPGRAGGTAQIVLRSPAPAILAGLSLTLASRAERTLWRAKAGPAAASERLDLALAPAQETVAVVDLADHPTRLAARARATLRPELPPTIPTPDVPSRHAHRCGPDSALAQGYTFAAAGALVGVDLLLAVRTPELRGKLSIYLDERGAPAEVPLASLELALLDAVDPSAAPRWRSLDLPEPVILAAESKVWLALELTTGEALWALAPRPADPAVLAPLRRDRGEPWVARTMTFDAGPQTPWAASRPRLRNDGPPPPIAVSLRRSGKTVALAVGPDGRVVADAAALAPLVQGPADAPLELVVVSPCAGRVQLDELRVLLPPQRETTPFPPKP